MGPMNKWHEAQDSVADWAMHHEKLLQAKRDYETREISDTFGIPPKNTRIPEGLEYQGRHAPGVYIHPERKERMGLIGSLERWILGMIKP